MGCVVLDRARRAFRGHRPQPGGVAVVAGAAPRVRDARVVAAGACSASPPDGRFQGPPRCRFSGGGAVATGGEVTAREQGGPGETVESRLNALEANLTALKRQTQGRFEQYERRQDRLQQRISDGQAELVLRLPKPKVAGSKPVVRSPFLPARRASWGRPPAS